MNLNISNLLSVVAELVMGIIFGVLVMIIGAFVVTDPVMAMDLSLEHLKQPEILAPTVGYAVVEYALGKSEKIKSNSTLELIFNSISQVLMFFIRGKIGR